jgi:hypothetical protein
MATEIDADGNIWLDADAAPFIDVMLDCIAQAEAREQESQESQTA